MKLLTMQVEKVEVASKVTLIAIFCFSACILCGIRLLSPLAIGSDSSAQIGAALGLLDIGAMGNYAPGVDLAQPPEIDLVTWFAPALSIFLFLLIKLGLTTEISLKLIYSVATIAGWFGWGLLFREVMRLTNSRHIFAQFLAATFAIILPIYFTFDWCGTDLLLWAVIPFIIYALYNTYRKKSDREFLEFFKIGGLIGFAYSIRYAAVSLLLGQILFLISARKFKQIVYVVLGYLTLYIPVSIFRAIGGKNQADHVTVTSLLDPQLILDRTRTIFFSLKNAQYLLLSHLTQKIHIEKIAILLILFAIAVSIYFLFKPSQDDRLNAGLLKTLSKEILFLNSSLVIFLVFVSFASSNEFLHITEIRYFYPFFPSLLLGAYAAVFHFSNSNSWRSNFIRGFAGIYLGIFLVSAISGLVFNRHLIYGFHYFSAPIHLVEYPSRQILTRHPQSYKALINLLESNPDRTAISFTEDFDFRHTPVFEIRRRILPASSTKVTQNITTQPLKIYTIFAIDPKCPSYCYYEHGKEVELLKSLPDVKLEYANQAEKIQILSATLPKDYRFKLNYSLKD